MKEELRLALKRRVVEKAIEIMRCMSGPPEKGSLAWREINTSITVGMMFGVKAALEYPEAMAGVCRAWDDEDLASMAEAFKDDVVKIYASGPTIPSRWAQNDKPDN